MPFERREEGRVLHTLNASRSIGQRLLQQVQRAVVLAQSRVDVREMIGGDVSLSRHLLELTKNAARLVGPPGQRVGFAELGDVHRVVEVAADRESEIGDAFVEVST